MNYNRKNIRHYPAITSLMIILLVCAALIGCHYITGEEVTATITIEEPQETTAEVTTTIEETQETTLPTTKEPLVIGEYQQIVNALRAIQPSGMPETKEDMFDINEYFTVLTHIFMEPGWVLDYVTMVEPGIEYIGDNRPILYVRQEDQAPFENYDEFMAAMDSNGEDNPFVLLHVLMYGGAIPDNKIRCDGTEESFIEYIMFQIMGGQFYLGWHANYDDAAVICDESGLEAILEKGDDTLGDPEPLPEEVQRKARYLKIEPVVTFYDDIVTVEVTVFTKWGGFFRSTYTINREYPHMIIDANNNLIIEYDCGVMF